MLVQVRDMAFTFFAMLPALLMSCLVLAATWVVVRLIVRVVGRVTRGTHLRRSLTEVLQKLASTVVWIVGVLVAAGVAFPSVTPANILTALGLGTIAIGFAFKDIFENFLAGILILFREPFRLGDFIDCSGFQGTVEMITIRDTHLRQSDGQRVVMPNATLFKDPVTVVTDRPTRRTTVIAGVAYGEDVDQARRVIQEAVAATETVDKAHPIEIYAQKFADSAIEFEVTWWCGSRPQQVRASRDKVVAAVKRALDDAGIEIPFPYRTLTFKEPLPIARAAREENRGQAPRAAAE